ncbi:hypothetical protein V3C99_013048 [Haemonchus contortus]
MFSSLLSSARDILENANQQPANAQQTRPQPPPQQTGRQDGAGDLLGGILQAVGKSLSEGNQPPTQQAPPPPPPAADGNQSAKGFNIRPEDVALITKGLGVLAQVVQQRTSAKGAEGEQAAKTNEAGNLPQGHCGTAEQGGDFLGGLMNMVKDFGNANKQESQGTSQLSQEDIARITAGLGTLATTLKEKAFGGGATEEEAVTKLDAQGGKVQVSSVVEKPAAASAEQPTAAGGDFLSGLMNVAKDVGKAFGEQNQARPASNTSGNTAQQLSPEDIARITAGLGSLVDTIKTKAFKKEEQEEMATKVDSQDTKAGSQVSHGAKPMSLLDRADAQAEQTLKEDTPDFLSGLLSVAKDVGKAVEKNQSGSAASGPTGSQGGAQLSQEDLAKLTAGLGSLVGAIQAKATDYFQKKPAEEESKPKDEPVIDDVEEEIGKVVLPGYTGYTDSSTVSKPKTT